MKKLLFAMQFVLVCVSVIFAADLGTSIFVGSSLIGAGLGVGLAAAGCGVGMGHCISSALQGIARQPDLTSKLQLQMMIGLAFIESLVLYALFIAIILLFANPFSKVFLH